MKHLKHLQKCEAIYTIGDGASIEVWKLLDLDVDDVASWAASFRQNYCLDEEIDELRKGTGLSRAQYLHDLVFPDRAVAPGPAVRSGDFAELLISDYVEHMLGYWVPRSKYADKASRDESVKGVDIIGFKVSGNSANPDDSMIAFEAKAQLTGTKYNGPLQNAVNDSSKDFFRRAITLNATKRRLLRSGRSDEALVVERFQNASDQPYVFVSGAAAVLSDTVCDFDAIKATQISEHKNASGLLLVVISGQDLMQLVHALYEAAANGA